MKMPKARAVVLLVYSGIVLTFLILYNVHLYSESVDDAWSFFYMFTFQTNILVLVWLVTYGVTEFVGRDSKIARLARHPILITAFALYTTLLMTYIVLALSIGFHPVLRGFVILRDLHLITSYFLTPFITWFLFFTETSGNYEIKKSFSVSLLLLIYPILYFTLNMMIGFNVNWSYAPVDEETKYVPGGPAFAYPFLDPGFYPGITVFIIVMLSVLVVLCPLSFLLVKIKQNQVRKTSC